LWKILLFVALCLLASFIVSARLQPIYEATAAIDVDRNAPTGVVGQEANRNLATFDADQYLATHMRLLQSDAVLRPVAVRHGLLDREGQTKDLTPDRRARLETAPVVLKRLRVSRPANTYLLLVSYRSPDPALAAAVSNGIAQSYLEHTYNLRMVNHNTTEKFMETQLEELQSKVERSGQALANYERALGLMNPEDKTTILSARLLQLNTEYTNAQADRVRKEAVYNATRAGSLEAVQNAEQGRDLLRLEEQLKEARQRFAEVRSTFGTNHPEYRKSNSRIQELQRQIDDSRRNIASRVEIDYRQALNRENMLEKTVAVTKTEHDRLNSRSAEYQRLKQEAEADKKLYEELVRKIREAGINAGFQNNNARLADMARPPALPVSPNIPLNMALALVLSTLLAVAAAILSDILDTTVKDPEQTSRVLRTDVIGTLPAVKNSIGSQLLALTSQDLGGATEGENGLVKVERPQRSYGYKSISSYEEAIRTLRNTILLADFDRNIRSMLVTSASPGEGKSTTAVHLAIAHAQQGKRTLLIDADLRRPTVHKKLGIAAETGLSNVLMGQNVWKDVVLPVPSVPDLFIIPSGPPSRRASDLIGPMMGELLDHANSEFDLVVVDAPPTLGFAEPLQIATIVDAVLVVTRAGETKRKAVASVISTLRRLRANVIGIVLNQVKKDMSDHYYYYGHYRKYYGQDLEKAS
jgi:capsular exopolysaccharide synthesis family protein